MEEYKNANLSAEQYEVMYQQSIQNPDAFWAEQANKFLDFTSPWETVFEGDLTNAKWFKGAKLNACYNCVDRHLEKRANHTAIIWEGDDPRDSFKLTYQELYEKVCQFANVLKAQHIKKGSRVCIYMPMIPEAAIAMLACARIGAIHSVVFGGFSSRALQDRIEDAKCELVITADEGIRAGKIIPLKSNVEAAVQGIKALVKVIVVRRTGKKVHWDESRDIWYHEAMQKVSKKCPPEEMDAEDPLFILYTSGSTGKPKGVLHTTAGYMLYAAITHKYIFDYHDNDVYWCTADVGWITGHTYIIYGPLANAATTLMFEGIPTSPSPSRAWEIIDKHQVNIFYTAPTAIRSLMRAGDEHVTKTSRKSLRILGSVGEPINPEAWEWYYNVVGESRCPIVDTWWQTETGGIMISALPGVNQLKPGSANKPFFGILPEILDAQGRPTKNAENGKLTIAGSWPGQMRDLYNNHERFIDTYFKDFPGKYYTGDGAFCDKDGDYWIIGRLDDVINVSGHRIGTAEVESALVLHTQVTEAALVSIPDKIRGSNLYVFVTLKEDAEGGNDLKMALQKLVVQEIGSIARPKYIQFCTDLPKTRSGKIMRRILRCIACNEIDKIGDVSTLGNPEIIDELIKNRLEVLE